MPSSNRYDVDATHPPLLSLAPSPASLLLILFSLTLVHVLLSLRHIEAPIFHRQNEVAPVLPPALLTDASAPATSSHRTGCFIETSWDTAVEKYEINTTYPWFNPGTYDLLILNELIRLNMKLSHGYYMETGAWKGEKMSHSWLFESHLCWTGILVEPSQAYFECKAHRPESAVYHAGLVNIASNGTFIPSGIDSEPTNSAPADANAILSIKPNADLVPAYSLETILRWEGVAEIGGVDFWTLDVEGLELQVLSGLGKFRPRIIIMEIWDTKDSLNKINVLNFMMNAGYEEGVPISEKAKGPPMIQDFLFVYKG